MKKYIKDMEEKIILGILILIVIFTMGVKIKLDMNFYKNHIKKSECECYKNENNICQGINITKANN